MPGSKKAKSIGEAKLASKDMGDAGLQRLGSPQLGDAPRMKPSKATESKVKFKGSK